MWHDVARFFMAVAHAPSTLASLRGSRMFGLMMIGVRRVASAVVFEAEMFASPSLAASVVLTDLKGRPLPKLCGWNLCGRNERKKRQVD